MVAIPAESRSAHQKVKILDPKHREPFVWPFQNKQKTAK